MRAHNACGLVLENILQVKNHSSTLLSKSPLNLLTCDFGSTKRPRDNAK